MCTFEAVRKRLGDRAALRALHYYREMELVDGCDEGLVEGARYLPVQLVGIGLDLGDAFVDLVAAGVAVEHDAKLLRDFAEHGVLVQQHLEKWR